MSKEKKSKKARKPNVPLYTGPIQATGSGGGGLAIETATTASAARPARAEAIQADYSHTVSDLRRIGLLAGILIAGLVALSFFIK